MRTWHNRLRELKSFPSAAPRHFNIKAHQVIQSAEAHWCNSSAVSISDASTANRSLMMARSNSVRSGSVGGINLNGNSLMKMCEK